MQNRNLFVITGGPGSGKTTVLLELEKYGFQSAPEIARQIIQEQVRVGGKALPWEDRELYTRMMLERSIQSFQQHAEIKQPMFSDCGIPDALGYARRIVSLGRALHFRRRVTSTDTHRVCFSLRRGKTFTKLTRSANRLSQKRSEPTARLLRSMRSAGTSWWNCQSCRRRLAPRSLEIN